MGDPNASTGQLELSLFGLTDVGQIREHNEDNLIIADLSQGQRGIVESSQTQTVGPRGTLFGVCDGMGGAAAGEVASQMAVDIVYERLTTGESPTDREALARLVVGAIEEAGARIYEDARTDRTHRGMGTTSTIGAMLDNRIYFGQVGDSRAYLMRGDQFVQVTRDQSLVNQLIEAGQLTEEEAETFEHNNIILQALGTADSVQVDLTYADVRDGDTLMLCSDGLSGMLRDVELKAFILEHSDPAECCQAMITAANEAGGHDNVTVIIVKIVSGAGAVTDTDDPLLYRKCAVPDAVRAGGTVPPPAVPGEPPPASADGSPASVGHAGMGMNAGPDDDADGVNDRLSNEPVILPTNSVPPAVVGFLVFGALMLVAVTGFVLLR
ncbi:MAG: Stp1/IreP family PP2C-type Ser/Thr phosphatase [Polyangiaceae bacterium]|nr:Stp1/IreP family PP2C-type Ser/Thr phosphatase [Polyangiaceae bacterium]